MPSALAMDKDLSKRLLRDHGITTPAWLTGSHPGDAVVSRLGLPVIVKPVSGGSSVRLTLARSAEEIDTATRDAVVTRDPESGTRTKDVTWTGRDGQTASRTTVGEKTEDGRSRTTTVTRPDGSTVTWEEEVERY